MVAGSLNVVSKPEGWGAVGIYIEGGGGGMAEEAEL